MKNFASVIFLLFFAGFGLAQGDSGSSGPGIGGDSGIGGTCCSPSRLNTAAMVAGSGNFTTSLPASPATIINRSLYPSRVLVIAENYETGMQEAGAIPLDVGESVDINPKQYDGASLLYFISLQRFEIVPINRHHAKRNIGASIKSPALPLNLIRVLDSEGNTVIAGVDEEFNVHFPVHGEIVGSYDLESRTVTLMNGDILSTE